MGKHMIKYGANMPEKFDVVGLIADWWQFLVFALGAVLTFLMGKERQRYKVDQIGKEVQWLRGEMREVRKELKAMHEGDGEKAIHDATSIAKLDTDIEYLKSGFDDLRNELRRKADK